MKHKKLFSLIVTMAALFSLRTTAFATYGNEVVFTDVPSNYWANEQITYFVQQGIVDGYPDGSFKPKAGVTREEFCKLLVSTFRQPLETPNTPTFSDVSDTRWSYPYVEVCKEFLTGYANPFGGMPTFHPTEYATREDIAVALVRMMGLTARDANDPNYAAYNFSDGARISPNLLAYVSIACERGLINGYPDGTFGPTKGITRAETVVLLNRATKQSVTDSVVVEERPTLYIDALELAGIYDGVNVMPYTTLQLDMYSSPEDEILGNYEFSVPKAGFSNRGVVVRHTGNVFRLISDEDQSIVTISVIDATSGALVLDYLDIEGQFNCEFQMIEHFVS